MSIPNQEELRTIVVLMLSILPLAMAGLGTWLAIKVVEDRTQDNTNLEAGAVLCWVGAAILGVGMLAIVYRGV